MKTLVVTIQDIDTREVITSGSIYAAARLLEAHCPEGYTLDRLFDYDMSLVGLRALKEKTVAYVDGCNWEAWGVRVAFTYITKKPSLATLTAGHLRRYAESVDFETE